MKLLSKKKYVNLKIKFPFKIGNNLKTKITNKRANYLAQRTGCIILPLKSTDMYSTCIEFLGRYTTIPYLRTDDRETKEHFYLLPPWEEPLFQSPSILRRSQQSPPLPSHTNSHNLRCLWDRWSEKRFQNRLLIDSFFVSGRMRHLRNVRRLE